MSEKRTFRMILAICAVTLFPAFTGTASAGDEEGGQAKEGSGYAYQEQNQWSHRNVEQNRLGDMGENTPSGQRLGFVDENGDGIHDLARDDDEDGIPNGRDPDWVKRKRDGTGTRCAGSPSEGTKQCVRSQHRGNKRSR